MLFRSAKTKGNTANKTDKKSTEDKPKAKSSDKHAEEEVLAASVKDGVSKSEKAKTEKSSVSAKEKNEQPNGVKTNKEVILPYALKVVNFIGF